MFGKKGAEIVIFFRSRLTANTKSPFTFNHQAVTAFTALVKGHAGLELFSCFINLNDTDFKRISKHLYNVVLTSNILVNKYLENF